MMPVILENQTFEKILDGLDLPLHIINPEGVLIFANAKWENANSLKREEVKGMFIDDVIAKTNHLKFYFEQSGKLASSNDDFMHFKKERTKSAALEVLKCHQPVSMMTYNPKHDTVLVNSVPIFDDDQNLVFVLTFMYNFTQLSQKNELINQEIQKNELIRAELKYYRDRANNSSLIGNSEEMVMLRQQIEFVSKVDSTILITGETGAGKEVLANEIFKKSNRNTKPFIKINCAAIPDSLIESELFGYVKGAFTGADKNKIGLFELANHGTLLLDEIGELPLHLQPKLLRALQEKEIQPIGSSHNIPVDVRVFAVTNRNLMEMVKQGKFRQDLYYRLNVIPIKLPPLRDRRDSIPNLCDYFLDQFNLKYGKNKKLSPEALSALIHYDWPGNIRELENILERLVIIGSESVITLGKIQKALLLDTPDPHETRITDFNMKEAVRKTECSLLTEVLKTCPNSYKAAKTLGISQASVVRKAHEYGIQWP